MCQFLFQSSQLTKWFSYSLKGSLSFAVQFILGGGVIVLGVHNLLQLRNTVRAHKMDSRDENMDIYLGKYGTVGNCDNKRTHVTVRVPATSANMGPGVYLKSNYNIPYLSTLKRFRFHWDGD
jgi:hypothetical protein